MIESVQFRNFRVLRDTTLPLERFTLIIGPNGSGKSTALKALRLAARPSEASYLDIKSVASNTEEVQVVIKWGNPYTGRITTTRWIPRGYEGPYHTHAGGARLTDQDQQLLNKVLSEVQVYSFDARALSAAVQLVPNLKLDSFGAGLAGVLDQLRDRDPDRFEGLRSEFARCIPEFDQVTFKTVSHGYKELALRTREGRHMIRITDVSQGTLLALAILTLAYIPDPLPIVCLEDPDRGLHPRLLRDVQDALYRLSYPEDFGERRPGVQVLATTHSPYFLDLFRDHPAQVVIAHKAGQEARFERLSTRADLNEILGEAHLGDVWYSGILGGVPSRQ
ncbi:MAG: AAA family ATPase [Candidatus Binatia bacterium]